MAELRLYSGNGHSVTIADPENITRDECLQLARCGNDAWNEWREAYPTRKKETDDSNSIKYVNIAEFSHRDFAGENLDFSGFNFGDGANFFKTVFASKANFFEATFGKQANFTHTEFGKRAMFRLSRFGRNADFSDAKFEDKPSFVASQFGFDATFKNATFGVDTDFSGAQFRSGATFKHANFRGKVSFAASTWWDLQQRLRDRSKRLKDSLPDEKAWAQSHGLSPEHFDEISWESTKFCGGVSFSNRGFRAQTNFKGVQFNFVPEMHNCQLHQDTSFDEAKFPDATGNELAVRAYRTLKHAFGQQQAIREEMRFFKYEMKEDAKRGARWRQKLMRAYGLTSDYGFGIRQPACWFILLPLFACASIYFLLIHHLNEDFPFGNANLFNQWVQFSYMNMLPFPDSELLKDLRAELFSNVSIAIDKSTGQEAKVKTDGIVKTIAVFVEGFQKLLALIGYFLIGLALRNFFKMK